MQILLGIGIGMFLGYLLGSRGAVSRWSNKNCDTMGKSPLIMLALHRRERERMGLQPAVDRRRGRYRI